jgi:uncharacterized protein with FMN-binding domain
MKKNFLWLLPVALLIYLSCNNNKEQPKDASKDKTEKVTPVAATNDPTGTYITTEDGKNMQFTLTADGKGYEMYGEDKRPFTWKNKDGKYFFIYDGETNEFELPIDVAKGEIHYGSLVYKKQ